MVFNVVILLDILAQNVQFTTILNMLFILFSDFLYYNDPIKSNDNKYGKEISKNYE